MAVELARPGPGEFTNAELVAALAAMVRRRGLPALAGHAPGEPGPHDPASHDPVSHGVAPDRAGPDGDRAGPDGDGTAREHAATTPPSPTQFLGRTLRGVVVLVVDGLGWRQLLDCAEAPFMTALAQDQEPIRSVLPSTTVTNLASIGTGRHGGDHGLLGYTMVLPDDAGEPAVFNPLTWRFGLRGGGAEARTDVVPESLVPRPTMFERLATQDVTTTVVLAPDLLDSGLTRAVLRGGQRLGAAGLDATLATAVAAVDTSGPAIAYCHHPTVDHQGHLHGPDSAEWRAAVAEVDQALAAVVTTLPGDVAIVVTADHGMVGVPSADVVEIDDGHPLLDDVVLVAGEPRMRTLVVAPDVVPSVVADRWQEAVGERATVATTTAAVAAGWFGPDVPVRHARRLGDVVIASHVGSISHARVDPHGGRLAGMHGGMTAAEREIPALLLAGA